MSEVFIYDDALAPIGSTLIQIVENDSRGVMVDVQTNTAQPSGLHGAIMKQPSPMGPVGFWVDDTAGTYAPTGFEFLNPGPSLRLDVTLFPLPAPVASGGGGGGGGGGNQGPSPDDADDLTLRQGGGWRFGAADRASDDPRPDYVNDVGAVGRLAYWTNEEMRGVSILIATIAMARTLLAPDEEFLSRMRRWESWLERLGVARRRGGRGSGGPLTNEPIFKMRLPQLGFGEAGNMLRLPMEEER